MPYCTTLTTPEQLHIALWHLNESLPQLLAMWGNSPLPLRYEQASAEKRRREILATALLMRHYFGHDTALHHAPNGAPFTNTHNISISHTLNYVAIALHPTRRVGVDIELIKERALRVAPRFLNECEMAQLPHDSLLLPDGTSARATAIHMAWSVKEAVYKLYSTAVDFRNDIHLSPFITLPNGSTTAHLPATNTTIDTHYQRYDNCSLAWVIEEAQPEIVDV